MDVTQDERHEADDNWVDVATGPSVAILKSEGGALWCSLTEDGSAPTPDSGMTLSFGASAMSVNVPVGRVLRVKRRNEGEPSSFVVWRFVP